MRNKILLVLILALVLPLGTAQEGLNIDSLDFKEVDSDFQQDQICFEADFELTPIYYDDGCLQATLLLGQYTTTKTNEETTTGTN